MLLLSKIVTTTAAIAISLANRQALMVSKTALRAVHTGNLGSPFGLQVIENAFNSVTNVEPNQAAIVKKFFDINYLAVSTNNTDSNFEKIVKNLPDNLSNKEKLACLAGMLKYYPAKTVFTGHPTNIASNDFIIKFNRVFENIVRIGKQMPNLELSSAYIKQEVIDQIQELLEQDIVMPRKKTPDEEAEYTMYLKTIIIKNFPEILDNLVEKVSNILNVGDPKNFVEREYIKTVLQEALLPSFMIEDWTRADFDGNHAKTADSMKTTLATQQKAIIKIYQDLIQKILTRLPQQMQSLREKLLSMNRFYERCIKAIDNDILFDVASSNSNVKKSLNILEGLKNSAPKYIEPYLQELITSIKSFGYFGGMLEYVRQSTDLNYRVWNNFFAILGPLHPELQKNLQTKQYSDLSLAQQTKLLRLVERKPEYFRTLKTIYYTNPALLTEETQTEIARLIFIMENDSIFPYYIFSDTKAALNLHEFRILAHLVRYLGQKDSCLKIGEIKEFPLSTLFLCETPQDLENFHTIFNDALKNQGFRNKIIKDGCVKIVSGPSDVGKTGGLAAHIGLFRAQDTALGFLRQYKKLYPELQQVELQVLNGYGGDVNRNIGSAETLLHSTCQGFDAFLHFGMYGMYQKYLENVIGDLPENIYKTQEIINLRTQDPKRYEVLLLLEQLGIQGYQAVFHKDINQKLLETLSLPELEPYLNKSSRAGAKKSLRAIGVTNLFILSRVYWNMFSSIYAWQALGEEDAQHFPYLYENISVVKNIVLKALYSIAMSNFEYADKIIAALPDNQANKSELAAHWQVITQQSLQALDVIIRFLPETQKMEASQILQASKAAGAHANTIALSLIEKITKFAGLQDSYHLELHQDLEKAIARYKVNPNNKQNQDNVALCARLLPLSSPPAVIGNNFFSPLRKQKFTLQNTQEIDSPKPNLCA
jgi:Phosphoenolpyruvate carboxylase